MPSQRSGFSSETRFPGRSFRSVAAPQSSGLVVSARLAVEVSHLRRVVARPGGEAGVTAASMRARSAASSFKASAPRHSLSCSRRLAPTTGTMPDPRERTQASAAARGWLFSHQRSAAALRPTSGSAQCCLADSAACGQCGCRPYWSQEAPGRSKFHATIPRKRLCRCQVRASSAKWRSNAAAHQRIFDL